MGGESSFPYRKYDRKPHPHIVKQILEDSELIEVMREVLIHEGRPYAFCHRKLKEPPKERELVALNASILYPQKSSKNSHLGIGA